jgi:uncharacterized protein YlxW (UPF0749 family)
MSDQHHTDQHRDTGTGWPGETGSAGSAGGAESVDPQVELASVQTAASDPAPPKPAGKPARRPSPAPARVPDPDGGPGPDDDDRDGDGADQPADGADRAGDDRPSGGSPRSRLTSAGAIIGLLLALLGFTLVIQLRSDNVDSDLAAMREDDLVRLQSDLTAQEERLQREINRLEESRRQLQSGAQGRQAALDEAGRRADELAILAGTAPASGPGLIVELSGGPDVIAASDILNAVQELRGADGEAMQIAGVDGTTVRVIASTSFVDDDDGVLAGGKRLTGPYTITVIGDPPTMRTALNIPDGLVPSIRGDGGNVTVRERESVEVTATSAPAQLEHARPVS